MISYIYKKKNTLLTETSPIFIFIYHPGGHGLSTHGNGCRDSPWSSPSWALLCHYGPENSTSSHREKNRPHPMIGIFPTEMVVSKINWNLSLSIYEIYFCFVVSLSLKISPWQWFPPLRSSALFFLGALLHFSLSYLRFLFAVGLNLPILSWKIPTTKSPLGIPEYKLNRYSYFGNCKFLYMHKQKNTPKKKKNIKSSLRKKKSFTKSRSLKKLHLPLPRPYGRGAAVAHHWHSPHRPRTPQPHWPKKRLYGYGLRLRQKPHHFRYLKFLGDVRSHENFWDGLLTVDCHFRLQFFFSLKLLTILGFFVGLAKFGILIRFVQLWDVSLQEKAWVCDDRSNHVSLSKPNWISETTIWMKPKPGNIAISLDTCNSEKDI